MLDQEDDVEDDFVFFMIADVREEWEQLTDEENGKNNETVG